MIGKAKELIVFLCKCTDDKIYEIKEYKEKRSTTANSYYWVILGKLARALGLSNDEMHEKLIKRYSDCYLVPLIPTQNPNQIFQYYDYYKDTKIKDKEAIYYKVYVRSSIMNTIQFSKLLDGIISEAKEIGIETLTPIQLSQFEDYRSKNEE